VAKLEPEQPKALAAALVESGVMQQVLEVVSRAMTALSRFVAEHPDFYLTRIVNDISNWPDWQRELWAQSALNGWYVNWHTPITINRPISEGKAVLDAFMIGHLKQDWTTIASSIISALPRRKAILQCAFELHTEKRYIASIPLFLAQADGVCAEYLGAHLFVDKEQREERLAQLQASKGGFAAVLLHALGLQTQFGAGISKYSEARKELAPNRNGILHGSRRHLDYGTEINSLKAFSLLAFVVYALTGNHDGSDA
jgi:hypothetical protein